MQQYFYTYQVKKMAWLYKTLTVYRNSFHFLYTSLHYYCHCTFFLFQQFRRKNFLFILSKDKETRKISNFQQQIYFSQKVFSILLKFNVEHIYHIRTHKKQRTKNSKREYRTRRNSSNAFALYARWLSSFSFHFFGFHF